MANVVKPRTRQAWDQIKAVHNPPNPQPVHTVDKVPPAVIPSLWTTKVDTMNDVALEGRL